MLIEKQLRREQADKRQAEWDALTLAQKIEKIKKREKLGLKCSRERAKFNKLMQENAKKNISLTEVYDENEELLRAKKQERQKKKVIHDKQHAEQVGN